MQEYWKDLEVSHERDTNIQNIEKESRGQTTSPAWFSQRAGRITRSNDQEKRNN